MTADEFAKAILSENAKFYVSNLVLVAEAQKIRGRGTLRVQKSGFELELEVTPAYKVPDPKRELWKPEHAWKLSGLIEGCLKFSSETVSPSGKFGFLRFNKRISDIQRLHVEFVELVTEGLDSLRTPRRAKIFGQPVPPKTKYPSVEFQATILGCNLVLRNAGTKTQVTNDFLGKYQESSSLDSFIDRNSKYDFCLKQRGDDLSVYFRSKTDFRSISEDYDWEKFNALLFAIGFTHGFQPWPYRIQYWRGGKLVKDRIKPREKLNKTAHSPFSKEIGFTGVLGKKGAKNSVIRLAANFFEIHTPLSEGLAQLLYLFREAGNTTVYLGIRTMALCSLFEGIVSLIFEDLELKGESYRKDNELRLLRFDGHRKRGKTSVNRNRQNEV